MHVHRGKAAFPAAGEAIVENVMGNTVENTVDFLDTLPFPSGALLVSCQAQPSSPFFGRAYVPDLTRRLRQGQEQLEQDAQRVRHKIQYRGCLRGEFLNVFLIIAFADGSLRRHCSKRSSEAFGLLQ